MHGEIRAKHGDLLESAGRLFKYLYLGEPDKRSPFGWRPTRLLLKIICAGPVKLESSTEEGSALDFLIIDLLRDAAWSDGVQDSGPMVAFDTLRTLGLVRYDNEGRHIPTPRLIRMFKNAYFRHLLESAMPKDFGRLISLLSSTNTLAANGPPKAKNSAEWISAEFHFIGPRLRQNRLGCAVPPGDAQASQLEAKIFLSAHISDGFRGPRFCRLQTAHCGRR